MNSIKFEMLLDRWPELATLGGFAEQYARTDPSIALIKLRTFPEHFVEGITGPITSPCRINETFLICWQKKP